MLSTDSRVSSLEASSNKQRQRRRKSSVASSNHSYDIDRLLQDESNDWFFEKILEKFENIRSKKVDRYVAHSSNDFYNDDDDDHVPYAVERIVERRYYVKKSRLGSKRDQLTSTSDLTVYGRKNRQYSGVSSVTTATTICSQCSTSTPTYIENLRDQSDTLRNEINGLKNEIEQLQTSQQEFFQQLRTHFQSKPDATITPLNFVQPMSSSIQLSTEKLRALDNLQVPLSAEQKSRSTSTESQASSSSSSSEQQITTVKTVTKSNPTPSSKPVAPISLISEFIATKNPTIVPTPSSDAYASSKSSSIAQTSPSNRQTNPKPPSIVPTPPVSEQINPKPSSIVPTSPVTEQISSKPPSIVPTPPVSEQVVSKPPSIAPTPPVSEQVISKPPSIAPTPPVNEQINSKPLSITPTPPVNEAINPTPQTIGQVSSKPSLVAPTPPLTAFTAFTALKNPVIVPAPSTAAPVRSVNSRTSSVVPTPPIAPPLLSSARIPIYENELAHRRVLSPRSQIVASSASIQDSSDSSSGSTSPELIPSNPKKILKAPITPLRTNELNDLVQYSSQLEFSGFPPSITPVITNPNTSSIFWDSVDQYIDNVRSTNINIGLPPTARSNHRSRLVLNNNTTKQLDKYDLEIKPQVIIESSAPLLMPPLDILS